MLTLIREEPKHRARYLCDCGNEFSACVYNVRRGNTKSCGCLNRRVAAERRTTHGHNAGGHSTKVYRAWKGMRSRCNNTHAHNYPYYGGRGIGYDPAWERFENFFRDMGHPPSPKSTLDRLDNSKGYSKSNCAWVTQAVQNRNKRNNVQYAYKGQLKNLDEWSTETGIPSATLRQRLWRGCSVEEALTTPVIKVEMFQWQGQSHTLQEWADITGMQLRTLRKRLQLGWSIDKVLTVPPYAGNRVMES